MSQQFLCYSGACLRHKRRNTSFWLVSALLSFVILVLLLLVQPSSQVTVWTRSYDNSRTGANLQETILHTNNVNVNNFGLLFSRQTVGHIYAQILYVPSVNIQGKVRNIIVVATMANNVYVFDADDASAADPLWVRNYGDSVPVPDPAIGVSIHCGVFTDVLIEIGITGTPVIDTSTQTLYFVTMNKESVNPLTTSHKLHAVDLLTGYEKPNSPVLISANVPGTGAGSNGGRLSFLSVKQNQRAALTLANGIVLISFGSYCTSAPYHGWIIGYDKTTLQQRIAFATTPNDEQGSVWQSGQGLVVDGNYIIFSTANGAFNPATNAWANSIVKLDMNRLDTNGGADPVVDYFTPKDWRNMYVLDLDLGTSGTLLIPDTDLCMTCSKIGECWVVNKNNMGGYNPNSNNVVQYFKPNPNGGTNYGAFVLNVHSITTWSTPSKGRMVYMWQSANPLRAFHFIQNGRTGTFNLNPDIGANSQGQTQFPGGILSISANGDKSGTGILWASHPLYGSANRVQRNGILRAYDAENIGRELWNSNINPSRDSLGGYVFAKFHPPMVANGKVYLGTFSNPPGRNTKVLVYGLLAGNPPPPVSSPPPPSIPSPEPSRELSPEPPVPSPSPEPEPSTSTPPPSTFSPIRINCGGNAMTDSKGLVWAADMSYSATKGPISVPVTGAISGTSDPYLYQTARYQYPGLDMVYQFTVPNDMYSVTLHFAEVWNGAFAPGARVFSCTVNGEYLLTNFDIFVVAGGANKAIQKSKTVTVTNGVLEIRCMHVVENPSLNAIQVTRATDPTTPPPPPPTGGDKACQSKNCGSNGCCNGQCYDVKAYWCMSGLLCPIGFLACGRACYRTDQYNCCNGSLCPKLAG